MGVNVVEEDEQIFIPKTENLQAVDVKTLVYPGFPTDLQQPFSVLLNTSDWFVHDYRYRIFRKI